MHLFGISLTRFNKLHQTLSWNRDDLCRRMQARLKVVVLLQRERCFCSQNNHCSMGICSYCRLKSWLNTHNRYMRIGCPQLVCSSSCSSIASYNQRFSTLINKLFSNSTRALGNLRFWFSAIRSKGRIAKIMKFLMRHLGNKVFKHTHATNARVKYTNKIMRN